MERQAENHFARDDEYTYVDDSFHIATITSTGADTPGGSAAADID